MKPRVALSLEAFLASALAVPAEALVFDLNYNFGADLVKEWVERASGEDARWKRFEFLLTNPVTPGELLR